MSTSCSTFNIPFTGTAVDVVKKIHDQVIAQGGIFTGDASAGQFDVGTPVGHIAGIYSITTPQQIDVDITRKPALVPSCKQIEDYITEHI
ncbi:hypothetical protein [Mucilaginibacter sp. UYCu711]|uniref:hypothetical protein n=1 Tax=Mucilaginibacter sp. UYCu711 TaxID=3156339 RepID=UPI003D1F36D8